ncbi:MAG: FAD-dependent oxidoreductase [Phycisphaeraceae bacterium]|nr:FAD-dependent oxidoreductase [Phycisphaeraceae bacterium]
MSISLYARLARRFAPQPTDEERREFLRASMAAGAALMLSGPGALGAARGRADQRIIVIGAGLAGLACAHELLNDGHDVLVLEARNRIGGRVLTFDDFVPGRTIEGGGELIGANHPLWIAYAARLNLAFTDVTESEGEFPVVLGGRRLTAAQAEQLWEEMTGALPAINADALPVNPDFPWRSPDAAILDARSVRQWIDAQDVSPLCSAGLAAQLAADNAVAPERQSYLALLACVRAGGFEKYWTDSEAYRCRGGNAQLARALADRIGPARISTRAPVESVERAGNGVRIRAADGREWMGDQAVLATPPTVWPRVRFEPALPADLAPQMGCAIKHLSHVRSRFWERDGLSADMMTDGEVGMTWDATDGQHGAPGGGAEPEACLTAFSGGPGAERLRGRDADDRERVYAAELGAVYTNRAANLRGTRFMDWPGDEWARCGYSFPAPGEVTRLGPRLNAPLWDGRLHLAGEHTCIKFVGYMEGALQSGVRIARRIARRDRADR